MRELSVFIRQMRPYRSWVIWGAVLTLTTLIMSIALLTLSGWFITASALVGGTAAMATFNFLYPSGGIRFFAIGRVVSRYGERIVTHEATFRILARLRAWIFTKALPLSPSQLGQLRSGDLVGRITADIDALDNLYLRVLVPAAVAIAAVVMLMVLLGVVSPLVAVTTLLGLLGAGVAVPVWLQNRGRVPGESIASETGTLRTHVVDLLDGLPDLLSYGAGTRQLSRIRQSAEHLFHQRRTMARLTGLSNAMQTAFTQGAVAVAVILGAVLLARTQISGPQLALLAFATLASFEAVAPLGLAFQYLGRTRAAARRLLEIGDARPLVHDPLPQDRKRVPERLDLSVGGVTFTYPGADQPALREVTLFVHQGSKIAIMGPSGGGKSTLLALLLRLYDPDQGTVRLGGVDIRTLTQEDLWARVGFLSQRPDLFSATIRGNLLLAKPDASDAQLRRAVELAGLAPFVDAQPRGIDTYVGESGVLVSGGEARRIALARVLLKDAPILLLDEPTEGLDAATEADVLAALSDFAAHKTVVLVTHRQALLKGMGRVEVIESGRLLAQEGRSGHNGRRRSPPQEDGADEPRQEHDPI